jgi:predicted ArsR family transcriptional regulator
MSPLSAVGARRMRILRILAGVPVPATVPALADKLGLTFRSVRDHLAFLQAKGLVVRHNRLRWKLRDGFTFRGFDANTLC